MLNRFASALQLLDEPSISQLRQAFATSFLETAAGKIRRAVRQFQAADEFENSLGVNCMGPLTDFILSRANDLQFIITSHHPYIINNIPKSYWKIVRRKGSAVRVTPASEIPALQGPSAQHGEEAL